MPHLSTQLCHTSRSKKESPSYQKYIASSKLTSKMLVANFPSTPLLQTLIYLLGSNEFYIDIAMPFREQNSSFFLYLEYRVVWIHQNTFSKWVLDQNCFIFIRRRLYWRSHSHGSPPKKYRVHLAPYKWDRRYIQYTRISWKVLCRCHEDEHFGNHVWFNIKIMLFGAG